METMDHKFPLPLFPSYYEPGPADQDSNAFVANCGSYDSVIAQCGAGPQRDWTFKSRNEATGEMWRYTEPLAIPVFPPNKSFPWSSAQPNPLDFTQHIQNFYVRHHQDAFRCMSGLLAETFIPEEKKLKNHLKTQVSQDTFCSLLSDVVHDVPLQLLGRLLHEELTEQRDQWQFSEGATGGALAFIPSSQSGGSSPDGCLLYSGNQGLDLLNFHSVKLQQHGGAAFSPVDTSSSACRFKLTGPVRQISVASLFNECCVAVRSDHLCGVWQFSERNEPRLLQVIGTSDIATCVSTSPHILGEVLVASESGVTNLWTVGRGIQKVRAETHNLYFNAKSPWRWCEFSAHPRVMLYADRTGAELTDMRESGSSHTLFRIGKATACVRGERLVLSRYLGHVHPFHHLFTTQHSFFIMDERFPCVPMLKCDHMMKSPPMFCHVPPGPAPSGTRTTKVLLGSQRAQEVTLLQYSGGRVEACSNRGPPQSLLRPRDALKHLPVQIPHRHHSAANRLSAAAAGLTSLQWSSGAGGSCEELLCVFHLTEAGDVFYQILKHEQADAPQPETRAAENTTLQAASAAGTDRQPVTADEGFGESAPSVTYESSEESDSGARRLLRRWSLPVVENTEPQSDDGEDAAAEEPGEVAAVAETTPSSSQVVPSAALSDTVLATWKRWLSRLARKELRRQCVQRLAVPPGALLSLIDDGGNLPRQSRVKSLNTELRAHMSRRSPLLDADAPFERLDLVPVPEPVDTEAWTDQLSQRLTVSWQGEDRWREWWVEDLGLNREEKVKALRRKRRMAKRASGGRLQLSSSFTSSCSYQSQLDDFSDCTGWSQGALSDTPSQSKETVGCITPAEVTSSPGRNRKRRAEDNEDEQRQQGSRCIVVPSADHSIKPPATPARHRMKKRLVEDYLSSLFASQEEPSDGSSVRRPSQPAPAGSSQLHGSPSVPHSGLRVELSQESCFEFSQSLFSQSSLDRASVVSKPKKSSRMGF